MPQRKLTLPHVTTDQLSSIESLFSSALEMKDLLASLGMGKSIQQVFICTSRFTFRLRNIPPQANLTSPLSCISALGSDLGEVNKHVSFVGLPSSFFDFAMPTSPSSALESIVTNSTRLRRTNSGGLNGMPISCSELTQYQQERLIVTCY